MVEPAPVFRRAGRILLLDPQDRVLLSHDTWGGRDWWTTPGGGIEPGETPEQAAVREVFEETGFGDIELGPLVIRHHFREVFYDYLLDQEEWIFLGRTAGGEPDVSGLQGLELEFMLGFRWWTAAELRSTAEVVYPRRLGEILEEVLAIGTPAQPWRTTE